MFFGMKVKGQGNPWLNGGTLIWLWHGEGFKPW